MTDRKTDNELVRDRIPEIIAADERQCDTNVMIDGEYCRALLANLVEEVQEVAEETDLIKEIADLYKIIDALLRAFDLDKEVILAVQQACCEERGSFMKRIKLL